MVYFFIIKFLQSKILLYSIIFLLVLKIFTVVIFVNFPQNIFFADITRIALINLVNQGRQEAGLQPLIENEKLDSAAKLKAEDMVQKEYFSHQSPEGTNPWYWFKAAGYNYKYAGENLAIGFFDSQDVYWAWLNSPSHKDNLLNSKYKEMGIAVLSGFGPNNAIVVVQLFGSPAIAPAPAAPAPVPLLQNQPESISEGSEALSQYKENIPLYSYNYNYDKFLQYAIYGFLTLITIALFFYLLAKRDGYDKGLIFRSLAIIVILSFAALLNKEAIFLIFPRQIII